MLTKAIFTGGVLALLSGSIVYFGTEGADALEKDVRAEETELAGAPVSEADIIKTVEAQDKEASSEKDRVKKPWNKKDQPKNTAPDMASETAEKMTSDTGAATVSENNDVKSASADMIDPPVEATETKPKTKWLDQYLKSTKPKQNAETESETDADADTSSIRMEETKEDLSDQKVDLSEESDDVSEDTVPVEAKTLVIDVHEDGNFRYSDGTIVEDEDDLKIAREALEAFGDLEVAEMPVKEKEIRKKIVIKMDDDGSAEWQTDDENIEMEIIEKRLRESEGVEKDIRILRLDTDINPAPKPRKKAKKKIDYDLVLDEARKLQVIDMRNIAFFEIIDYAIDRKDFGKAADILQDLSDPELRDTARAKIGVGLAKTGDSEAAFAVLDEMEIDELTASMRLEIITALMATKAERKAPGLRR
jgi:hypothetical protein